MAAGTKTTQLVLALLVVVAAFGAVLAHRFGGARVEKNSARPRTGNVAVEFSNFSARHERSPEGDRLIVALRLRTPDEPELACFVFVLAQSHNDPAVWSAWPPQNDDRAITRSGQFHGAFPAAGFGVILTPGWERVTSTHPEHATHFDTVVIYVVAADGRVLLNRPFRV